MDDLIERGICGFYGNRVGLDGDLRAYGRRDQGEIDLRATLSFESDSSSFRRPEARCGDSYAVVSERQNVGNEAASRIGGEYARGIGSGFDDGDRSAYDGPSGTVDHVANDGSC